MPSYPQPGTQAPLFDAYAVGGEYGSGTLLTLEELLGMTVILYFYPKDDTPGCTSQACGIRDEWIDIPEKVSVFGVSVDSTKSHEKFINKYQLPFPLLSDSDHSIAKLYGVWVEKNMYGKTYFGTERTTFIIDPKGNIKAVLPKVKADMHLEQLLRIL